jgi:RNA recognition motif-containing protein
MVLRLQVIWYFKFSKAREKGWQASRDFIKVGSRFPLQGPTFKSIHHHLPNMSSQADSRQQSRMLYVKNLNYNVQGNAYLLTSCCAYFKVLTLPSFFFSILGADLYELFGRYGAIRQIRIGDQAGKTKGTAFVVFEEIGDAKNAMEHLNGFHLQERYIVGEYARRQLHTICFHIC